MREPGEAIVIPMTEEELARRLAEEGNKVVYANGRYWREVMPGLYDGVHWFARHSLAEARKPTPLCWGYRAVLCENEAANANGAIPAHVIADVENYDLDHLPARTRRDIRRFERNDARIVWVDSPEILLRQGYEVMLSWLSRIRHREAISEASYLETVERNANDRSRLILAGVLGDKLLGYQMSWMVDGTVYVWEFHSCAEAQSLHLSSALWFETAQVYRRTGMAREICAGLAMPEKDGLTDYKERLGYKVVHVPTRVWLLPALSMYIRRRHPKEYYRFTGRESDESDRR